jgi:tetratricopeptide (TPR) repeat protein
MGSRLLDRIEARIAEARDPVRHACWRAQRAIYLARQGSHDAVVAEVQAIRDAFGTRPQAEVTAWVSLAEAVNSFYSHPGPQALDRLKRAQALARAIGHVELQALCAAWLAHLEFNANRMEPMVQHAAEALRLAGPDHHAALARASLVVADAYHFAGRFDLAKDWYAAVRQHALAEGDDAMISAMLHNVATFRASNVRVSELFSTLDQQQAVFAMLQAQSTQSYDVGIGTVSLSWFVPLIRAQLLTSEGKYEEAAALFSANLGDAKSHGLARLLPSFYSDYAWCCLRLNRVEMARDYLELAIANAQQGCDPDDLATTYARAERIALETGLPSRAAEFREVALSNLEAHKAAQQGLLGLLSRTLEGNIPMP